jgi:flagellar hook-basal body complex protein FliE
MDISALSSVANLLTPSSSTQGTGAVSSDGTGMFDDIFNGLISNVNDTDSTFQSDIVQEAAGELDNPQQLMVDSSKATIALQLVSSVRNDALQAYNEIMRIQA